ncbi:MAG: hypothetical protein KA780_02810 [Prolixibacteraceae bacterium]|jgi:hypothetical protein|nr:hypothetical protein [Prolixibacteraceae bacterium]
MNPKEEPECCPQFDPIPWDDRIVEWQDKKFIKEKVRTILYMPLNFGAVMGRVFARASAAGVDLSEGMGLSDHTSRWNMDIYIAADKELPGAENTTFSGKFFSKVYEGPYSDTKKWCKEYDELVKAKGLSYSKMYMWYVYCPKCAKKYGKNYTVIVGRLNLQEYGSL